MPAPPTVFRVEAFPLHLHCQLHTRIPLSHPPVVVPVVPRGPHSSGRPHLDVVILVGTAASIVGLVLWTPPIRGVLEAVSLLALEGARASQQLIINKDKLHNHDMQHALDIK